MLFILGQNTLRGPHQEGEKGVVLSISIDPSIIDPEDAEFLQDLVLEGVKQAIDTGKEKAANEMKKLTGGMGMPGMPGM